jgi:hypothetical protein
MKLGAFSGAFSSFFWIDLGVQDLRGCDGDPNPETGLKGYLSKIQRYDISYYNIT